MVCWIWPGMSANGLRIGIHRSITGTLRRKIHPAQMKVRCALPGVGPGRTHSLVFAQPTGLAITRKFLAPGLVFVVSLKVWIEFILDMI